MFVLRRALVDKDINGHRVKQSHALEGCRCTLLFSVFIAPSLVNNNNRCCILFDGAFQVTQGHFPENKSTRQQHQTSYKKNQETRLLRDGDSVCVLNIFPQCNKKTHTKASFIPSMLLLFRHDGQNPSINRVQRHRFKVSQRLKHCT